MIANRREEKQCACCGYFSISEEWEICSVCFWEDNWYQAAHMDDAAGPNTICLRDARENFQKFGASEERFILMVRPPKDEEQ